MSLRVPSWIPGSGTINAFFEWVEGIFSELWDWIDWVKGQLSGYVQDWFDSLWSWIEWLRDRIAEAKDRAEEAIALAQATAAQLAEGFVQEVTNIYQSTTENVTNVYNNITENITNVYETINNIRQETFTTIQGVTEAYVSQAISTALAPLAPLQAFLETFGEQVGDFFSDPDGYIVARLESIAEKQAPRLLRLAERLIEAMW